MAESTTRLSSSYFQDMTFTLSNGGISYDFKGDILAKMSKKVANLLRQGITHKEILRHLEPDTFEAFVSACKLEPFKVTPKNAHELYSLAQEWEIPSLEKFANEFIQSKKLEAPEPVDYLQVLKTKAADRTYTNDDIKNVSSIINDAMESEDFTDLPPEIIFQCLLAADPYDIDPENLLNLTLELFDKKASSAVPVTTLIDFEKMNAEQRKKLILNEKMNTMNFTYFVAQSLSHFRNHEKDTSSALQHRVGIKILELAESAEKARKKGEEDYNESHVPDMEALKHQIERQEEEIKTLRQQLEADNSAFQDAESKRQEELDGFTNTVKEINDQGEESGLFVMNETEQTQKLIAEHIDTLRDEFAKKLEEARAENSTECDGILEHTKEQVQEQSTHIDAISTKFDDFKTNIDAMDTIVKSTRSTLAAKIVRDKLRMDEFIRDNENRFEIFNNSEANWELTPDDVKGAEEMIDDFEGELNNLCPIRGNAQTSPPPSPRAQPKAEESQTDRFQLEEEDFNEEEEEEEEEEALSVVSGAVPN
ncbi:hypothetical protein M9Y10_015247 [Tritrichomonas musculus]|uniref:Uncharacterized protein n=1 Tax=Tritrichomonas musculus TaxID=1915356 RepID=A0ABR2L2N1_9EUKA